MNRIQRTNFPTDAAHNGDWFSRERVLTLVLLGATVLALYLCWRLVVPFLPAFTWAIAFAVVAYPAHLWLAKRLKNATAAASLSVFLVAVLLIVPGILVAHQLINEAVTHAARVQEEVESGRWRASVANVPGGAEALAWVEENVDFRQAATRVGEALGSDVAVGPLVVGSIWSAVQFVTMLFLLFYFFRDRPKVIGGLRSLLPLSRPEADRVFNGAADAIHATVYGTFVVAAVQGVMGGLLFWAVGLPAPVFWGVMMFLLGVIPYLGAFMVWVPAAVSLAANDRWGAALLLTAWGVLMAAIVVNWLYAVRRAGRRPDEAAHGADVRRVRGRPGGLRHLGHGAGAGDPGGDAGAAGRLAAPHGRGPHRRGGDPRRGARPGRRPDAGAAKGVMRWRTSSGTWPPELWQGSPPPGR
jgi:predicted PurR-regulated permease PerM